MESIGNKDKLLSRIIDDAKLDAKQTRKQADETIESINLDRDERIAALIAEHEKARDAQVKGIVDGHRTRSTLEARKEALKDRREIVDKVFDAAHTQVLKLDDDKRKKLYLSMLHHEAVKGDRIMPAKADRAILSQILPQGLTLTDEDAPINGGFRIIGKGYEKDCSTDAIMAQLRMDEETQAARKLFE